MAASKSMFYWGYVIVLSKFVILFIDTGIAKSFGVLIPTMVERLDSDYATVGLMCSMPSSFSHLLCPFVKYFLTENNHRVVAMSGAVLCGSCLITCGFLGNLISLGVCLGLAGIGLSMTITPIHLSVKAHFQEKFVLANTVSLYGYTAGSVFLPILIERSLQAYGYSSAFLILGGVALNAMACAATIRKEQRYSKFDEGPKESDSRKCFPETESHNRKTMFCRNSHTDDEEESEDVTLQRRLIQVEKFRTDKQGMSPDPQSITKGSFFQSCQRSCGLLNEPLFLFSTPILFISSYNLYSWMLFLVPHTEQLGIQSSNAVFLSTIGGIGGIIGRTVFIILLYKGVNAFAVFIPVSCICAGSFLLDFISSGYQCRAALAFIQGFCFFIEDALCASLSNDAVFDDNNCDTAIALSMFWYGLGGTISGTFSGYLFDLTQSFTKVFIIIGISHSIMAGYLAVVTFFIHRRR
ncbi:monocarboxylate transporter 7-like [Lytechinus variegatus]|uniref:monocarboxylate transporter 7-like n=1 Tax=Lytechinus variegatus TaxID=7654 RepID=UPI001BB1AC2A|nr:monocarboxylate transporter 7-like [Lytechinus variegatus]